MRLNAQHVVKHFDSERWPILDGVTFSTQEGEFISVYGESGSGKSTLFSILSLLEPPSAGSILIDGADITMVDEPQRAQTRLEKIGAVFPAPLLIPTMTAMENVVFPMKMSGRFKGHHLERAIFLLSLMDLAEKVDKYPEALSLEERQRVSLARALANRPGLLLADEPTNFLDEPSSRRLITRLRSLQQSQNITLILFTRNKTTAHLAGRRLTLKSGKLGTDPN